MSLTRSGHKLRCAPEGWIGQLQPGRDAPTGGSFGVDAEALIEASRLAVSPEVDPDAVGLDFSAAVPHQRPAPSGRHRRQAAAPSRELELTVLEERDDHVDPDTTDDPRVIGASPAGLVDIVTGDVLEVTGNRIEPEPPARVHVG
jgi:hypothetical protein